MSQALPEGAYLKDVSAHYNQLTIPRSLLLAAPLQPEIWGRLVVETGMLRLFLDGGMQAAMVTPESPAIIPAGAKFRVEEAGEPVRFYLEYYHVPRLDDGAELADLLSRAPARRSSSSR